MTKLTKDHVSERLQAALALLGHEDCEDQQSSLRLHVAREALKRAMQEPVGVAEKIANDL
ncbi:hypothetical protein [Phyllobacterium sp. K27]